MEATASLAAEVGTHSACSALDIPRATYYRHQQPKKPPKPRPTPPLALSESERQEVLALLRCDRFLDQAPRQVWAQLLAEDVYLCSVRTMYRYLEAEGETRERRRQRCLPTYSKPELLATAPNQVWSWDITKLKGPVKWTYYYLYVIIDIFSRCVVGWMIAHRESAKLAEKLIEQTLEKQKIVPEQLTIHADRGPSMTSKLVAQLLGELGVTKTHSRPYTSNDNPFSEAHFKTLKYRPDFPNRFGSFEDAETFCQHFFQWYNDQHRHTGLALMTPRDVHYGRADRILEQRTRVLRAAFEENPSRFKERVPRPGKLPEAVWINPPRDSNSKEKAH